MASPVRRGSLKYLLRQLRSSYRKSADPALAPLLEVGKQVVGPKFLPFLDLEDKGTLKKVASVREEFLGQPGLSYIHACLVIFVRRGYKADKYWQIFVALWDSEYVSLSQSLNSRWLISALDTIADMAAPDRAARAMSVVAMFNMMRFSESELAQLNVDLPPFGEDNSLDRNGKYLWDNIEVYDFRSGDAMFNMIQRMRILLKEDTIVSSIFASLMSRALAENTLLRRISENNVKLRIV